MKCDSIRVFKTGEELYKMSIRSGTAPDIETDDLFLLINQLLLYITLDGARTFYRTNFTWHTGGAVSQEALDSLERIVSLHNSAVMARTMMQSAERLLADRHSMNTYLRKYFEDNTEE